jgi:hypothetical protein
MDMERIACVGLEPRYVRAIKKRPHGHVVTYEVPPRMYSLHGRLFAESLTVNGKWLQIDRLFWYGYFPDFPRIPEVRRAIALAAVPAFPDLDLALIHDDRVLSLILATRADPKLPIKRGYLTTDSRPFTFEELHVLKVGNDHCGDGKRLINGYLGGNQGTLPGIIEPFIKGESIRVLVVGEKAWVLKYESKKGDWRKNVDPVVTEIHFAPGIKERGQQIAKKLDLSVVGIDFIGSHEEGWQLLEVNAYPGLEDVPEAQDEFERLLLLRLPAERE